MPESRIESTVDNQNPAAIDADQFLQALVMIPEKTSLEIGVTLNVNGLLITGFLISQATYFESLVKRMQSTKTNSETGMVLEDFLIQFKDVALDKARNSDEADPFIHLRDVKIYPSEGRGMPTFGHALWRGDIRAVNGFTLGEMVPAHFDRVTK